MMSHRIARRILLMLLPRHTREFVVGDIEEEYENHIKPHMSPSAARHWYWRQAISSLISSRRKTETRRAARVNVTVFTTRGVTDLLSDIRFALRSFWRSPSFFFVSTATLTLGVGSTTTIFSVADAVLWRPLPYQEPGQIVLVGATFPNGMLAPVSPPVFFDWQDGNTSFASMAGVYRHRFDVTGEGEPLRLQAAGVSATFVDVLGIQPAVGRWFLPEEDAQGGSRVVVMSNGVWTRHWGGDPNIIGQTVLLDETAYTVIGIMPKGFLPPEALGLSETDLWFPMAFIPQDLSSHANWFIRVIARLRDDVSMPQAQTALQRLTEQLEESYSNTWLYEDTEVKIHSLFADTIDDSGTTILMLLGAVSLLLLIACTNVANLFLARATDRQDEVAVRTALGAGRSRIVRQFLTESILLSLVGAVGGIVVAVGGVKAFAYFNPGDWPRLSEVGVDARVLMFAVVVAIGTGLVFGSFPAFRVSQTERGGALRAGGRRHSGRALRNRFQQGLAVTETGLALILLVGAGLLMNSFVRLNLVEPGFAADDVTVMHLSLSTRYETKEQRVQVFNQILTNLQGLPGVSSGGFSNALPFGGGGMMGSYVVEGREPNPGERDRYVPWQLFSEGYFETLQLTPLSGGRLLTSSEIANGDNLIVVNTAFAQEHWPDEPAIGKRIKVISTDQSDPWLTVVGVIPNVKQWNLARPSMPQVYVPYSQPRFILPEMDFIVRSSSSNTVGPAMRQAVWTIDPDLPVDWQATLIDRIQDSVAKERFYAVLLGTFATVAVILAAVGIYGIVTYSVEQRTRELGIRLALGGTASQIVRLIVRQTVVVLAVGVTVGVAGAFFAARLLNSLLYGVSAGDPSTFGMSAALLAGIGIVAGYLPARRATRVGIVETLRAE